MKRILALFIALLLPASAYPQQASFFGASPLFAPGFIVSDWYSPFGYQSAAATPAAAGANTIACAFGAVLNTLTINTLGGRITTPSSGGNVQFAVYSAGSWGRPGTLLASTASISTTSAAVVNGAASVQLPIGSYWFCQNADNGTVVLTSQSTASGGPTQYFIGTVTQGSSGTGAAALITGVSISQTFGTWPNFTSSTAWTEIVSNIAPYIAFKVASVP